MDDRRLRFGDRLRRLREQAGLSGRAFAMRYGWQASKVSKIETGKQLPSDSDLDAWLAAAEVPESLGNTCREDLRALRLEYTTWKRQLRNGFKDRQVQAVEYEGAASVIRVVETSVIPGFVQTARYAEEVFRANARFHELDDPDVEEAVRVRMRRQDVLYAPDKRIELLVFEAALRYPVGTAEVMLGNIDRLLALTGYEPVRFGIISLDTVLPVIPMHGYWIVDDAVLVETVSGELTEREQEPVALYNRLTDELWTVALEGDAARELLVELANRWRAKLGR